MKKYCEISQRVWKSDTCQDRFIGFFLFKLLFLEHPWAQAALDLAASRAPTGRRCQHPSDTAAGRDRPHHMNPPGSDAIPQVSITGELRHRRDQHWQNKVRIQQQSYKMYCSTWVLVLWLPERQKGCLRRHRVRINQPNVSGSDVPRPWLCSHVWETPKEHAELY